MEYIFLSSSNSKKAYCILKAMNQTLTGLWYMMTTQLPNLDTSSPPNVVQGRKRFDLPDPPRHGPSPPLRQQIFSAFSLYATPLQTNLITRFFQMCFLEYCSQRSLYLCLLQSLVKYHFLCETVPGSLVGRNFPFYWVLFLTSYHSWHILLGKVAIYQHVLASLSLEMRSQWSVLSRKIRVTFIFEWLA